MRVLIADHEVARAKTLAEACLSRGHRVERIAHGASALELALERPPDAVICPVDLTVIDGQRLAGILRSNPRTRSTSFIFLVRDELNAPISLDARDSVAVEPWHDEDILENLEAILERSARSGGLRADSEIEGKLAQISLPDLLQIFQMNVKTGALRLSFEEQSASIFVREGQVVDALIPLPDGTAVAGEKALYRLLRWMDGRFRFVPDDVPDRVRIDKPTRVALLEGMRHRDEWEDLSREMPPLDSRVRVAPGTRVAPDASDLVRDVLEGAETYRRISAIVDHCEQPDYQVLRCLSELLALGQIQLEGAEEGQGDAGGDGGLYSESQLRRVREWTATQRPRPGPLLKVLVSAGEREALSEFVELLRESTDFVLDGRLAREPELLSGICAIGHIPLNDGLSLRLLAVPTDPTYQPLWDVACHGMLGGIILPCLEDEASVGHTEAVFRRIRECSGAPVIQVALGSRGDQVSPAAAKRVERIGGDSLFSVPDASMVRELFVRLVP